MTFPFCIYIPATANGDLHTILYPYLDQNMPSLSEKLTHAEYCSMPVFVFHANEIYNQILLAP